MASALTLEIMSPGLLKVGGTRNPEPHRRKSRMREIRSSGSGEGPGWATSRPTLQSPFAATPPEAHTPRPPGGSHRGDPAPGLCVWGRHTGGGAHHACGSVCPSLSRVIFARLQHFPHECDRWRAPFAVPSASGTRYGMPCGRGVMHLVGTRHRQRLGVKTYILPRYAPQPTRRKQKEGTGWYICHSATIQCTDPMENHLYDMHRSRPSNGSERS
jgi:hypothetical protein